MDSAHFDNVLFPVLHFQTFKLNFTAFNACWLFLLTKRSHKLIWYCNQTASRHTKTALPHRRPQKSSLTPHPPAGPPSEHLIAEKAVGMLGKAPASRLTRSPPPHHRGGEKWGISLSSVQPSAIPSLFVHRLKENLPSVIPSQLNPPSDKF